ncbi:unnamed protein product [Penicillium salamii]|uniref:Uncharacterized protein n=1 Tax=Penicillium salamii TaxID=1612424 RepID=A0A9W4J696_9EURO|nr:unnamed protein product [Penicillium salamii]CAG8239616.1 unnamed protein product [Penicillium salamii]CAG8245791.1 unnamed protein product [Penicillium salamii]CAG8259008.1 unnamed protein product [Penicillium salamii]CAG8267783.1 unnamed protein product [Penicillium salamii]
MADIWRRSCAGRFSLSPTGLLFASFCFLYLGFFRYYHHVSHRDPTSYFFDPSRAYERRYSSTRIAEAEEFLKSADSILRPARPEDWTPTICIGIATVARREEQYVGLTVASLLAGLNELERKSIFLNLLIGNTEASKHPIYSEKWIETLPDRVLTYQKENPDFERIKYWENGGYYRNKTIYDYTHLLRDCYDTGAEYVAMIEDDTLAVKDWLPSALHSLDSVKKRAVEGKWIYLRLFYVDELLGWNSEEWPRYLVLSILIWALLTGIMMAAKKGFKNELKSIPTSAVWITSCIFIPAIIALHFMAGRQTMWPISPGVHEMNKYGCCSQGLVFPRAIIPDFLERTDLTTDWLVDMMIEKVADDEGWTRWAVVPPLLQHVGATSSKGHGFDDSAKTLWNFRFEDYPY